MDRTHEIRAEVYKAKIAELEAQLAESQAKLFVSKGVEKEAILLACGNIREIDRLRAESQAKEEAAARWAYEAGMEDQEAWRLHYEHGDPAPTRAAVSAWAEYRASREKEGRDEG